MPKVFTPIAPLRRGFLFPTTSPILLQFLFSIDMIHEKKKDGAGCIAIQKSLLTLQTEPLLVGFGQMVATLQPKT